MLIDVMNGPVQSMNFEVVEGGTLVTVKVYESAGGCAKLLCAQWLLADINWFKSVVEWDMNGNRITEGVLIAEITGPLGRNEHGTLQKIWWE